MSKRTAVKDRGDPASNRSLAIREMLEAHPDGTSASEIVEAVRKQYGHKVTRTLVYLVRSKLRQPGRNLPTYKVHQPGKPGARDRQFADMLSALKAARALLQSAGSYDVANELLKAVAD